jgi:lipopolysaccharide export system protein LptC
MSIGADVAEGHHALRLRSFDERERAFVSAQRHSRMVGYLRKGLPALALVVLATYFISSSLSVTVGDVTASISGVEVSGGNLRMTNPKLQGTDKKNGAYVIGADYADQDIKNPKVIKLHAIKAEIASGAGGWSRINAVRGVFDTRIERLVMQEKITIATSSGVQGTLTRANLDMQTQTLRSHEPVAFTMPNATLKASAMTLRSSDKQLEFRGKVRVHLVKGPKKGPEQNPQSQPATVLQSSQTPPRVAAPAEPTGAAPRGVASPAGISAEPSSPPEKPL